MENIQEKILFFGLDAILNFCHMYTCTLYRKTVCLHSKFYRETSIGSDEAANDIVLKGGLIEANHCVIHLKEGKLFSRENVFKSAVCFVYIVIFLQVLPL